MLLLHETRKQVHWDDLLEKSIRLLTCNLDGPPCECIGHTTPWPGASFLAAPALWSAISAVPDRARRRRVDFRSLPSVPECAASRRNPGLWRLLRPGRACQGPRRRSHCLRTRPIRSIATGKTALTTSAGTIWESSVGSDDCKVAFITGATGQDGAYLAESLLAKGYVVHGLKRRASLFNTQRVDHLYRDLHEEDVRFVMHYGDLTDTTSLIRIMEEVQPTEIYNLAAQSHVQVSFETPEYTANADALGTLRVLEAMRILKLGRTARFYQASTSELYGKVQETPQRESTPFYPRSPYGVAKLYAYWITVNYREAYGFHASNGILFNHESPTRGETFVTRKISRAVTKIALGRQEKLYVGNLDAVRDWGHARDYVEGMWMMLQQDEPDDYVFATGVAHSVREFIERAFAYTDREIVWRGSGVDEQGLDRRSGKCLVEVDPRYFRPTEVDFLLGDPSKAQQRLGWRHTVTFEELVEEMVRSDLAVVAGEADRYEVRP